MSWNEIKSRFLAFKSSALKSNAPTLIKFVSDSTIVFTAGNPSRLFSKDLETGIQIDLTPTLETNLNKTSLEEELIKERMRVVATGITDFTVTDSHILFSFGSNLYSGIIDNIKMIPIEISDPLIDYKLSPDLINVSFIKDRDLYTAEINTGIVTRHTFSDRPTLMNGVASYIIQEEFSRYTGYWWNPAGSRILYEIVDEKYVDVFSISRHSSVETYRLLLLTKDILK